MSGPIVITVGTKYAHMGDDRHGDPVVLDVSRAFIDDSGVTRIPVVNHACDCGGTMVWDDGVQIDCPGMAGAACDRGCGHVFGVDPVQEPVS